MSRITAEIIADIHSGEITMTREGHIWTDEEKTELYIQYYSGMGITELAYLHQRTENAIIQQLQAKGCLRQSVRRNKKHSTVCRCNQCSSRNTPLCLQYIAKS